MQKLAVASMGLALVIYADPLAAAEYCVVCAGPEATYRCQVEGAAAPAQDPRTQLLCISQLANAGGHDSCSITRRSRGADFGEACPGEIRIIAAPLQAPAVPHGEIAPSLAPDEPDTYSPYPVSEEAPAAESLPPDEEKAEKVPQTMGELASQTVKSSKEGLAKAGKAIGGSAKETGETIGAAGSAVGTAAKKTWNCLASLFKDC